MHSSPQKSFYEHDFLLEIRFVASDRKKSTQKTRSGELRTG